jgi:hypothetical protein
MLPFLKQSKLPRIQSKPLEEKLVQGSASDHLEDHCIGELMDACPSKNVKAFRSALEALVLNCFDEGEAN